MRRLRGAGWVRVDFILDLKILLLLFVANGAPVIAKNIFGPRFQTSLDAGRRLWDGEPLFGHSKTIRGILAALSITTLSAPVLGIDWLAGLVIAGSAMLGDLSSSFTKRRLKLDVSSQAIGIDQIPEALFPLVACLWLLPLTLLDVAVVTVAFVGCEMTFSKLLYRLRIRDRPY